MARFLGCLGVVLISASCSSGSPDGGAGAGGVGGEAGTAGSGATGGNGGAGGIGGSGGFGGLGGRSGSSGAAGSGGRGAAGGTGGADGEGGAAGLGGTGGGAGGASGNQCPQIADLTTTPRVVPMGQSESTVEIEVSDADSGPEPVRTRLSATTGTFGDPDATTTVYTCGAPGSAVITARATDGDPVCDVEQSTTVQCPDDIPLNTCPRLFSVNAIPSSIPPGQDSTEVQTQADDPDEGPLALVTTFFALYGTFDDPNAGMTTYRCERSGLQEICVDASDGACVKTLCTDVICPE